MSPGGWRGRLIAAARAKKAGKSHPTAYNTRSGSVAVAGCGPRGAAGTLAERKGIRRSVRYILVDKVTELAPGERITAEKALSLAEEYLGDHFPTFPVLPGVLMIEALVQSAAMLVRVTEGFRHSMIMLQDARNVKYKSFVKPGGILRLEVKARQIGETESSFVGQGFVGDRPTVEGRFTLRHYNLADRDKSWAALDAQILQEMKQRAQLVGAWRD